MDGAAYPNIGGWARDVWQLRVPGSGMQVRWGEGLRAAAAGEGGHQQLVGARGVRLAGNGDVRGR